METEQEPNNYAFIDSQNLNLGIKSQGWELDFSKFRLYLKHKYGVRKAYLFIGHLAGNRRLYDRLRRSGYTLVFKPTTEYRLDGRRTVKGNVDAELVLYASAKLTGEYTKAILVTGDGDFHCLAEYLQERGKLGCILVPNDRFSKLFRQFDKYVKRLGHARKSLELSKENKKTRTSGRSKP